MSGTNVVFTGPATDANGEAVIRADLKKLAERMGYRVQNSITPATTLLVASRADTVKARGAYRRGITVTTYAQFIARLGGSVPKTGAQPDLFVDATLDAEVDFL